MRLANDNALSQARFCLQAQAGLTRVVPREIVSALSSLQGDESALFYLALEEVYDDRIN